MSFSDDDLKRFGKAIKDYGTGWYPFSGAEMQSLLARLEAAEKVVRAVDKWHSQDYSEYKDVVDALEVWRKSKGEGAR